MPYTFIYDPETSCVEAKVQGTISFNEIIDIFPKAIQIIVENEAFFYFADYREAILDMSTLELYQLPKLLSNLVAQRGVNVYRLRRAVVIAKDLKDKRLKDYRFYETVTVNRGQNTKLFEDIDEAKKWLFHK